MNIRLKKLYCRYFINAISPNFYLSCCSVINIRLQNVMDKNGIEIPFGAMVRNGRNVGQCISKEMIDGRFQWCL